MITNIFLTAGASQYGAATIWQLIAIMQTVCVAGGVARLIYCLIMIAVSEEDANVNKKRAKHTVIFIVIGTCALQIVNAVAGYVGGPALSGG